MSCWNKGTGAAQESDTARGSRSIVNKESIPDRATQLQWSDAITSGDYDAVKEMLDNGFPLDLSVPYRSSQAAANPMGPGAYVASRGGQLNVLVLLDQAGADLEATNKREEPPILIASFNGHTEVVRYLITCGVNVNQASKFGRTPLFWAATMGDVELVKLLVLVNADIEAVDGDGVSILDAAADAEKNSGALLSWLMEEAPMLVESKGAKSPIEDEDMSGEEKSGYVMLSYCWAQQEIILKIASFLKAHKIKIWLDTERMHGSTMEQMAAAVEGATVVLMAISPGYQNSANCRLEGEYASVNKKPIIPLMMQTRSWKPTGWLGITVGAKLWFDFSPESAVTVDEQCLRLLDELRYHLDIDTNPQSCVKDDNVPTASAPSKSHSGQIESQSDMPETREFQAWSCGMVQDWAKEEGYECFCDALAEAEVDGRALKQLVSLRKDNPQFYFEMLEKILRSNSGSGSVGGSLGKQLSFTTVLMSLC